MEMNFFTIGDGKPPVRNMGLRYPAFFSGSDFSFAFLSSKSPASVRCCSQALAKSADGLEFYWVSFIVAPVCAEELHRRSSTPCGRGNDDRGTEALDEYFEHDVVAHGRVLINRHQLSLADDVCFTPKSGREGNSFKKSA